MLESASRRRSQVVRQRSAKPPSTGSNPVVASIRPLAPYGARGCVFPSVSTSRIATADLGHCRPRNHLALKFVILYRTYAQGILLRRNVTFVSQYRSKIVTTCLYYSYVHSL